MQARAATAATLVGAVLAFPAAVQAHGLVQRANLPIPEWLFGWAATIVLVVSFLALAALWPKPKLEQVDWKPVPGGRLLGSKLVEAICGVVGVALLVIVIVAGFVGRDAALANLAPTFILITFWVGMAFLSAIFGDIFRAFNPWRALGRPLKGIRPYPERLGRWPAAAGLLVFTWIELVSGWGEEPRTLATAAVVYSVYTLVMQAIYGTEAWTRCGEAFSVYFNLFARLSVFETRDRVVGVRPLLGGLPKLDPTPGTVAVVAVMIGTVTYDGLTAGPLWKDVLPGLSDAIGLKGAGTAGLLFGVALVAGFYALGIRGARSAGGPNDEEALRRGFVHSLIPIALVYVAAHYLSFLIFEGQAIRYLASDPFGQGWDLFGTAKSAIDYSLLSQNAQWYLQVGLVVAGHVAALILAHDRALVLYSDARTAVRSQYWMLGIMVGFTTLALWLLAQAGAS